MLALSIYGILPVLRNTIVGLQGVDQTLVEAGRGDGMSARRCSSGSSCRSPCR